MKTRAGAILDTIHINRDLDRTINVQLYMGLREIILSGGLKAGERLPASRTLSSELGVSRTTVVDALDRLIAEGMLEAKVGAGTFVTKTLSGYPVPKRDQSKTRLTTAKPQLSRSMELAEQSLLERDRLPHSAQTFVTALPALDQFPMAQWARLSAKHWRTSRDDIMGYGHPHGLPRLRTAIATHLKASRGIHCDADQVFVVGGAQQAFSLIARVLLDPGDKVWIENPGAIGAANALISHGASLVPVQVDKNGLNVEHGLSQAKKFKLAFVTPSHQQPLGYVMSLTRRLELLNAVKQANAFVIEDDYDGEFHFGESNHPSLKSIDSQDRVIYVGTFSKSLFPSLRLGFIVSPEGLMDTFRKMLSTTLSGVPTSAQSITASFMDEGLYSTHIRQMRKVYELRHFALLEGAAELEDWLEIKATSGGFHTVADITGQYSEAMVVEKAADAGVILAPLNRYCIAPIQRKGVVMGFGSTNEKQIFAGTQRMAQLDFQ